MFYADLVIDNDSHQTDTFYTYGYEGESLSVGALVKVPFARGNRWVSGVVFRVYNELDGQIPSLKYISEVDKDISLTQEMLDTCLWMKKRYLCRMNDVIKLMLPSGAPAKTRSTKIPYQDDVGEEQLVTSLTLEQERALGKIIPSIHKEDHQSFLIFGVTSSGKTEIYMRIIRECLLKDKGAILLVPEISLTKQIIERFIGRFGAKQVAVLHSKLTPGQRYDEWNRIRSGQAKIVIGARSAIFAPLENIGAIILDEEHETTYKSDMTPKYESSEVAKKRAMAHNATLVLGSATPSVISMFRADERFYNLVELKERYNKVKMPVMSVVDMREELKQGNRSIFSRSLISHSHLCLEQGKQIILFLNRRGYANFVSCRECGYIMKCQHCGISLTYHRGKNLAVCHYCGHGEAVPKTCPSCSSKYIKYFGVGTEKVEEIAKSTFPQAKVARLDLDTIKSRGSIERILNDFKEGATQILVGTQLVAKGLDFENVGLVGIVAADVSLNIPDYRSGERTFQLITQAAGRAGRGDSQGQVVIQSYTPDHYAIQGAAKMDYPGFYRNELVIRRALGYPPFSDLIEVLFVSKEEELAKNQGKHSEEYLKKAIEEAFGIEELANLYPLAPSVLQRIGAAYRYHMLIRCPKNRRKEYTEMLEAMKSEFVRSKKKDVSISIDINPYSFL